MVVLSFVVESEIVIGSLVIVLVVAAVAVVVVVAAECFQRCFSFVFSVFLCSQFLVCLS